MSADEEAFPNFDVYPAQTPHVDAPQTLGRVVVGQYEIADGVMVDSLKLEEATALFGEYIESARQDPDKRVLYEHQVPVMEDLYKFLLEEQESPRGYISLPTGAGKTVLFTEFIKATGLRTLVVVPTKLLVKQTQQAFGKFQSGRDMSVGAVFQNKKDGTKDVTVTTYASLVRQLKGGTSSRINPADYDLLILDEAHKAMGDETAKMLDQFDHAIQVGLTATENYSDQRQLKSILPREIHKMTIREAVEFGLIAPFSNWVVQTETDMSAVPISSTNDYDIEALQFAVNDDVRNQLAVDMYRTYFDGQKVVFFCAGVEHAKSIAEALRENGVVAEAIHGGLSLRVQEEMKALFADREHGIKVLCNDKLLTEGFDEVAVAACFNLAPTLSYVRAQQRSGRSLRLDPLNPSKHAYVIDFVDRNYRKPPVLFADPMVAGVAHLGSSSGETDELKIQYNVGLANVTRDPEGVELIAQNFSSERHVRREQAPEGWMTISGVAKHFSINVNQARMVMGKMAEWAEELVDSDVGRYSSAGVSGGVTTYYSPNVIEGFSSIIDSLLPDRTRVAPDKWLSATQIAALNGEYLKDIKGKLSSFAEGRSEVTGIYRLAAPAPGDRKQFYSPEIAAAYMRYHGHDDFDIDTPPLTWLSEAQAMEAISAEVGEEIFTDYVERSRNSYYNQTVVFGSERFVPPRVIEHIERYLEPRGDWMSADTFSGLFNYEPALVDSVIEEIRTESPGLLGRDAYYRDEMYGREHGNIVKVYSRRFLEVVARQLADTKAKEAESETMEADTTSEIDIVPAGEVSVVMAVTKAVITSGLEVPEAQAKQEKLDFTYDRQTERRGRNQTNIVRATGKQREAKPAPLVLVKRRFAPSVQAPTAPIVRPITKQPTPRLVPVFTTSDKPLPTSRADLLRKYRR